MSVEWKISKLVGDKIAVSRPGWKARAGSWDWRLLDSKTEMFAARPTGLVLSLLLALFVVSACGPQLRRPAISQEAVGVERDKQLELALRLRFERGDRLALVAWQLRSRGVGLCGDDVVPYFGFAWVSTDTLGERFHKAGSKLYAIGQQPSLRQVIDGSPAAHAGLKNGDVIVEVEGHAIKDGRGLARRLAEHDGETLRLKLRRDSQLLSRTLKGVRACRYGVGLLIDDAINAFADGKSVTITSGMMRFASSDEDLALVVGHEMAHNILDHVDKQQANVLAGVFFGALLDAAAAAAGVNTGGAGMDVGGRIGGGAFSRDFESEADYLGTYMAARAGYRVSGAADMWRRMAVEHPSSIGGGGYLSTHPSTPERATALERTVEEIKAKQGDGRELVPERLESSETAPVR